MSPIATAFYDRIDSTTAVEPIVDEFYRRVFLDQELQGLFAGIEADSQRRHRTNFISLALSRPTPNRKVGESQQRRRISERQFGRASHHLRDVLDSAGVGPQEERAVLAIIGPLNSDHTSWPYDRSL